MCSPYFGAANLSCIPARRSPSIALFTTLSRAFSAPRTSGGAEVHPQLVVGVADLKESSHPRATIGTVGLGSCLGITCYDPGRHTGALLHAMLPRFSKYREFSPVEAMYVDTGISALLGNMVRLGSDPRRCEFKIFGGAQIMRACEYFKIGEQNIAAMEAIVSDQRLDVRAWEVGGSLNRSITLHLETGLVSLRMPNRAEALL